MSSSFRPNITGSPPSSAIPPDGRLDLIFHSYPLYYSPAPSLLPTLSDPLLAALAPLLAYWLTSAFFHLLDSSNAPSLVRRRIHDSAEVASRNRASRLDVLRSVLFQQVFQTALAIFWISEPSQHPDHATAMRTIARALLPFLGPLDDAAAPLAYLLYWWLIPAAQFVLAMVVLDTWQYFLHRAMHINHFLYKHLHSVHHRLYVPYAYGALYNHPIEGFVLDSLGAVLSEAAAGLSVRQATAFFVLSTCKTVDDHCGYRLPFDPLQLFSGNTADYHDIHHQVIGIKSNFSQPWFIHWDVLLGTRMTRQDIQERRAKLKSS
ncbi:fatty acid hydroxylase superfamily-domain-containing protein [Russula dissimulans]|nr:fatty acid hydroxylase superfamily-domain-containing protein [Russula dissimulans]